MVDCIVHKLHVVKVVTKHENAPKKRKALLILLIPLQIKAFWQMSAY